MFQKTENSSSTNKKSSLRPLVPLAIILITGYAIYTTNQNKPSYETFTTPKALTYSPSSADFQKAARARLDETAKAIPELENYTCEGDDCSSVIYFNFKRKPADLETIIRGNTATFSNFRKVVTGTSHVTFAAKLNGKVVFRCNGSNGQVENCKTT